MTRPPWLATALVRVLMGRRLSQAVVRDLAAEFRDRAREEGAGAARRWYWQQVRWAVAPAASFRFPRRNATSGPASPTRGRLRVVRGFLRQGATSVRLTLKQYRRSPGVAVGVIGTLGLGMAAATAVFTITSRVLLDPLPYYEPERIALVRVDQPTGPSQPLLTGVEYTAVQGASSIAGAAVVIAGLHLRMDSDAGSRPVTAGGVGVDLFRVLGVQPALGRSFASEDLGTDDRVAMLTWDFWQGEFGGRQNLLGESLLLDGRRYTVVGVLPPRFELEVGRDARGSEDAVVFFPVPVSRDDSRFAAFRTLVRLADGVEYATAEAELQAIGLRLGELHPDNLGGAGRRYRLVPLHEDLVAETRPAILSLLVAVGLVVVIACLNAAGLLVARAAARDREYAIRAAVGASRGQLMIHSLAESAILTLTAAALGMGLGTLFLRTLLAYAPIEIPLMESIGLDARATALSLLLTAAVTAGLGLLPSLHAARTDPGEVLRAGGTRIASGGGTQRGLVVAQIGVSMVLLLGSGLMLRTVDNLRSVPLGFEAAGLHTAKLVAPRPPAGVPYWYFFRDAAAALEQRPGMDGATAISRTPLAEQSDVDIVPYASTMAEARGEEQMADLRWVLPNAFAVLGTPLVEGRTFTWQEVEETRPVVVIDRIMAQRLWPDRSAVGREVFIPRRFGGDPERAVVVGVVEHQRITTLRDEGRPQAFRPAGHTPWGVMTLAVRSSLPPAQVFRDIRAVTDELRAGNLYSEATMAATVARTSAGTVVAAATVAGLSLIAALSSVVGLYSLLSFLVARGRRETGVRIALGAHPRAIMWKHVRWGMRQSTAGLVLGGAVALFLGRVVEQTLFGVTPLDPATWVLVSALFLAVSVAAVYGPARRAATVDPVTALRAD